MTRQKEVFKPILDGKVSMYVCGVTAYDLSHLAHPHARARAAVSFDVLYRYLQHLGYEVTYVRNFTDVDDKIIRRANELGENPLTLSSRFCQKYLDDMNDLHCLTPAHQPHVSDHMDQIRDMITQVIVLLYFRLSKMIVHTQLMGMCTLLWINLQIMSDYLGGSWKITELVNVLLLIQESEIQLTSRCGRLQSLVSQVGTAHGVLEDQDGT